MSNTAASDLPGQPPAAKSDRQPRYPLSIADNPALNPFKVMKAAIEQVPAVRYAVALTGIAAAASVVMRFVGKGPSAPIAIGLMLVGMVILYLVAAIVTDGEKKPVRLPALMLLWAVSLFACLMSKRPACP